MKSLFYLPAKRLVWVVAAAAVGAVIIVPAAFPFNPDTRVTVGSSPSPFAQNKQNEPALAIDAHNPTVLAAGANDEIDLEACNAGGPTSCPFTAGVGLSGVYFSFDSGTTWTQPTYTGWTARDCLGPAPCVPHVGPIGTLPWYFDNGLVSDGDPAVAFGPRPDASGHFSWANGSRLYYANLAANFSSQRDEQAFKGFEAIAVSRTDNPQSAAAGNKNAWCIGPVPQGCAPVIVSKQNAALFSDKEAISVDNAESSPFFGNVYICNAAFRGQEISPFALPEPIIFSRSTDGGQTWDTKQLSSAANTGLGQGRQGCTVRADSAGVVYVFWESASRRKTNPPFFAGAQLMARSFDGGRTFEQANPVASVVDCGAPEPVGGFSFDGLAGARTNSFPSVDIANGAPTGFAQPHNDRIVMTWCDGRSGLNHEQALVQYSLNRGVSWTGPVNGAEAGDRPDFPAVAVSPDGGDVYLTYDGFLDPFRTNTTDPRRIQGVVRHAEGGLTGWATLHRGVVGDARGSSANGLSTEFLGDYNYAAATNDYGAAVWNDARDAAVCDAVNAWRASLATSSPLPKPAPNSDCPSTFGNTDIFGGSYPDPTP
jgi:hypothetical protein